MIRPVIMCGGSGTRLWPLSRKSLPKQFIPILGDKSLLSETILRAKMFSNGSPIWVVASEEHKFFVQNVAFSSSADICCFLEPAARNTTAAMAVAALNANPEELLLFLPSDHYIAENEGFLNSVNSGKNSAEDGNFVIFGVPPTKPHCGYGYIKYENTNSIAQTVLQFNEKPNLQDAIRYLSTGNYYWNSGIVLVKAKTLLEGLHSFSPDTLGFVKEAVARQVYDGDFVHLEKSNFLNCKSESIDYSVLEHCENIEVVKFAGAWSDVGSWSAVKELSPTDKLGNHVVGDALIYESRNTYVYSHHRPVIVMGTDNLVVVDDVDALLVVSLSHSEKVKDAVDDLKNKNIRQAEEHSYNVRPWGYYTILQDNGNFKVKKILVKPGASLSSQLHQHRAEHWIVIQGAAVISRGDEKFCLKKNQSTYIPKGVKHKLENKGEEILEMIEIQTGDYLTEDDIIRFESI